MIGFFFDNKHSREFWMAMEYADRSILPERRRNDYVIAGRDGTVDFGNDTYGTKPIPVTFTFISKNVIDLQKEARKIASWLSGEGLLWFDDEPDVAYTAKVYETVTAEQIIRTKRVTVVFECQPFAKSIHFLQSVHNGVSSGHIMDIFSHGTVPTPVIIIITNTGSTNINNIVIRRRALNR